MVIPSSDPEYIWRTIYKNAKGFMKVGGLSMTWDLTGGMSEDEFVRLRMRTRNELNEHPMWTDKSGRIWCPSLGVL